jgi:CcmD family protein
VEQSSNLTYLFAAYTAFWAVLFGYVLHLMSRQKDLNQSIEEMRKLASEIRRGQL